MVQLEFPAFHPRRRRALFRAYHPPALRNGTARPGGGDRQPEKLPQICPRARRSSRWAPLADGRPAEPGRFLGGDLPALCGESPVADRRLPPYEALARPAERARRLDRPLAD